MKKNVNMAECAGGVPDEAFYDVCRRKLHKVFVFENRFLPRLTSIPDLWIAAPKNRPEFEDMLAYARTEYEAPSVILCPEIFTGDSLKEYCDPVRPGVSETIYDEKGIALLAVGNMVQTAFSVRSSLRDMGFSCSLVNVRSVRPVDERMLYEVFNDHEVIVTLEENGRTGGFGDYVLEYAADTGASGTILNIALPDEYFWLYGDHKGDPDERYADPEAVRRQYCIDSGSILKRIIPLCVGKLL